MKFAKYLETESVAEWRRAYINYKGLKRKLAVIEKVPVLAGVET
jgi:SPX domain protein involved in polyphosphate accumulation